VSKQDNQVVRKVGLGILLPLLAVVAAELSYRTGHMSGDTLAAPTQIASAFIDVISSGTLLTATRDTLTTTFGGLALGGTIGLLLGILVGSVPALDRLLSLPIELVRPVPSVALIPIAMIAVGFGYGMEIDVVAFAACWPLLITTRAAVQDIEPRLIEVARVLGLGPWQRSVKILLPASLPRIFVGFRLAAGIALIVAVTVEIAANPIGLGSAIMLAQQSLNPALMLALLIWIGIIGVLVNAVLLLMQRALFGRVSLKEPSR
jgi:ABC-type nitrate/sulfonate/bicarbonate transport system permease component